MFCNAAIGDSGEAPRFERVTEAMFQRSCNVFDHLTITTAVSDLI